MDFIDSKKVKTAGELYFRTKKNMLRLEDECYRAPKVFQDTGYDWPGDTEGRTLLGLLSDEKVLHEKANYLDEIMAQLNAHLNEDKYFGKKVEKIVSEQLLAGNSWFLRAICEHYRSYGDAQSLEILKSVHDNLLVKLLPFYEKYPKEMSLRTGTDGAAIGTVLKTAVNDWILSTDTGCAFIPLDGYTAVYEVIPSVELKRLIESAIDIFDSIDKVGIRCQTHATLSGTRGILRFYRLTGEEKYLKMAQDLFALYERDGMTKNYANYNWFLRPEWTEGCAVVDSFIVAMELFVFTGDYHYCQAVNRIYKNAFRFSQRYNGGLGCDICTTDTQPVLKGGAGVFEASWCCTMRCGEGLYRLSTFQYLADKDTVTVPMYNSSSVTLFDGACKISENAEREQEGRIVFDVKTQRPFTLRLYVPEYAKDVKVNGVPATVLDGFVKVAISGDCQTVLTCELPVTKITEKSTRYFVGDIMLGEVLAGQGDFGTTYSVDGKILYPIVNMIAMDEKSEDIAQKVVF